MNRTILTVCLALALAAPALAADRSAGRQKAQTCQGCHGLNGVSLLPDGPHIGGQNEIYLVKALKEFRAGVRKDERMSVAAENLTDQDIADLAAFYSSLEPAN